MICHLVETGDEAPIIDGLASIEITKQYRGPLHVEIWETRPHVLKISEAFVGIPYRIFQINPTDTLQVSLPPHLLKP